VYKNYHNWMVIFLCFFEHRMSESNNPGKVRERLRTGKKGKPYRNRKSAPGSMFNQFDQ
jgi:hypothetical protein